jgi:hypothetical protein
MAEQWVVTYRIETRGNIWLTEFFRGDHDECERISEHSVGGEDDSGKVTQISWRPIIGPASSWDAFVLDASRDDTIVTET